MRRTISHTLHAGIILFIGGATLALAGCAHSSSNLRVMSFNKPVTLLKKGDKVSWFHKDGSPMFVTFNDDPPPCRESAKKPAYTPLSSCTINRTNPTGSPLHFAYACDSTADGVANCSDPEIGIGPDSGGVTSVVTVSKTVKPGVADGQRGVVKPKFVSGSNVEITLACTNGSAPVVKAPPPAAPGVTDVYRGYQVEWESSANPTDNWTVTVPQGACNEGTSFVLDTICTISQTASSSVSYSFVDSTCNPNTTDATTGHGTLTVH